MDDAQLRTVWQQRQFNDRAVPLSQPLALLMKYTLGRRVRQLGRLTEIWQELIPEGLLRHTALESFRSGTLTVTVDSAPHRFQLRTLLDGGLMRELQRRFSGALNKVRLTPGQFARADEAGNRRYEF
ncbi:MAG TPA: DciA family protein [Phycisphaerae bacterium]|nr:DciA family protein [Phycisphaerae bacterium]